MWSFVRVSIQPAAQGWLADCGQTGLQHASVQSQSFQANGGSSKVIASGRVGVVYLTAEFFPFLFLAAFCIFSKLRLVNDEAWFESHPRLRHFST